MCRKGDSKAVYAGVEQGCNTNGEACCLGHAARLCRLHVVHCVFQSERHRSCRFINIDAMNVVLIDMGDIEMRSDEATASWKAFKAP